MIAPAIVPLLAGDGVIHVWLSPLGAGNPPQCGEDTFVQGPAFGSSALVCDACVAIVSAGEVK